MRSYLRSIVRATRRYAVWVGNVVSREMGDLGSWGRCECGLSQGEHLYLVMRKEEQRGRGGGRAKIAVRRMRPGLPGAEKAWQPRLGTLLTVR
jgi:hypothetical protein